MKNAAGNHRKQMFVKLFSALTFNAFSSICLQLHYGVMYKVSLILNTVVWG